LKVLITGAAGFIGRALCRDLIHDGHSVVALDLGEQFIRSREYFADLSKSGKLRIAGCSIFDCTALSEHSIGCDVVVHLAAMVDVGKIIDQTSYALAINIMGTQNVVQACAMNGVKQIVFSSTSAVYGIPRELPVTEETIAGCDAIYGLSKLTGEAFVKAGSQKNSSLNYTILRVFNIYGPGQSLGFIIPRLLNQAADGVPMTIYGDGSQKRCFTHVNDICAAFSGAIGNSKVFGQTFNIGNRDEVHSIDQLAKLVAEIYGVPFDFKFLAESYDIRSSRFVSEMFCNSDAAEDALNFKPKISLRDGLKQMVRAIKKEQNPSLATIGQYFLDSNF